MRLRDARLWAVLLAVAFLVLWCVSIGAGYAAPAAEPFSADTAAAASGESLSTIGVWGWALVGVGAVFVLISVILCNLPPSHRTSRRYSRRSRTIVRRYR